MVKINFGDWNWGREAIVSSVACGSDREWASWCESDEERYDIKACRAERQTC